MRRLEQDVETQDVETKDVDNRIDIPHTSRVYYTLTKLLPAATTTNKTRITLQVLLVDWACSRQEEGKSKGTPRYLLS